MKRMALSVLAPPLAVCRYGCAGCCAAPIGVFYLAGLASLVYGALGGPLQLSGISLNTVLLGLLLWSIASVWAMVTVYTVDEEQCNTRKEGTRLCPSPDLQVDDSDPLQEARKAR